MCLWLILLCGLGGCGSATWERPSLPPPPPQKPLSQVPKRLVFPKKPALNERFLKPISLTVADDVPLGQILSQLARASEINLALNASLKGKWGRYTAHQQPLIEVVQHLCAQARLRYRVCGRTLHIEEDTPYLFTYTVPFLLGSRKSQSRTAVTSDVFSGTQNKSGDNGSDTQVTAGSNTDFWSEIDQNLKMILAPGSKGGGASSFTFHKQAGLISVWGTQQQHLLIYRFFKKLRQYTMAQVMIEAKIIEVSLSDQFQSGINWNVLSQYMAGALPVGPFVQPGSFDSKSTPEKGILSLSLFKEDLSWVARCMEKFGSTRTLSSPRLTVLNNQPALLKAARNEVFFRLEVERSIAGDGKPDFESTTSRMQTVPIGLVMVVHPCVNLETQEVVLTLRPTVSRVVDRKNDPAVAIKSDHKVESSVPVVQVREMDSIVTLNSGEVIVMGGLMEDSASAGQTGVPGLGDVPFLSFLTHGHENERQRTELVVLLKATIITDEAPAPPLPAADHILYESGPPDPRPF